ncbi:metallophosphoesterase [Candidatus Solirubrobacter pratensis]|uniref:metallophosphoesterase n=1 Tax=Candidatus Solirubrobacter pratensis TaxID=1298857 RepID=UPI000487D129|nr:metallophosphoesterase [Candidatus Solirubrobacter pratensis]
MAPPLKAPFYVLSDTHFYHERILEFCGRPYDHEVMMVKRWQRTIDDSDTILHLGDLFFGGQEGYDRFKEELTPNLPGKKFIILGNHDKKKWDYEALGFTVLKPFSMPYRGYTVSFSHYPLFVHDHKEIHVHGHIHNHPYARGERSRARNINVSVEVLDYRPHRVTRLLNSFIAKRNGGSKRYYNSRSYRQSNTRDRGTGSRA